MTLPTFLLPGAAKTGTTSLWRYLRQHPEIFMCEVKEPHYFAYPGGVPAYSGPGDEHRLQMVVTNQADYEALLAPGAGFTARGEASAMYLYLPGTAARIAEAVPDIRLIVVLRDPVDRAFSAYVHHVRDGLETLTFSDAIAAERSGDREGWSPLWRYWDMGLYASQLREIFRHIGRDQVMILLYEEFWHNPERFFPDIFEFIGVSSSFSPDMSARDNVGGMPRSRAFHRLLTRPASWKRLVRRAVPEPVFRIAHRAVYSANLAPPPQLSVEVRERLQREYAPEVAKLEKMLSRDLSLWRKT